MDKPRSNVFIALVLVLLIIAAILAWVTGSNILSGAPVTANDDAKPVSTKAVPSASVSDNQPSAAPDTTSTPEPTAAPKPTTAPESDARTLDESGSIMSQTGANINMRVDWHITSASNKELTLDVEVYIISYAINAGEHSGSIRLCGKEYSFISEPIINDDNSAKHETLIYDATVTIPAAVGETVAVPISAKWDFDGMYGGIRIGRITAESTLTIKA